MDKFIHNYFRRMFNAPQKPTEKIPFTDRLRKVLTRPVRILLLLPIILCLGYLAHNASQSNALWDWENNHAPPALLIQKLLDAFQLKTLENTERLQKISKTLPLRVSSQMSFWISLDQNWVAVFSEKNEQLPLQLGCFECKQTPLNWRPLGTGWKGYLTLSKELENRPKPNVKAKITSVSQDKRALLF